MYADGDLGHLVCAYYHVVNELTGQVIGTHGDTTDANLGNDNTPDVELENAASAANPDTQMWHVVTNADGEVTLLNKSGGRAAEIWTGNAAVGQRIGQWVDDTAAGLWKLIKLPDGNLEFQSAANPSLYLTGAAADAPVTLQAATADGSQGSSPGGLNSAASGQCARSRSHWPAELREPPTCGAENRSVNLTADLG